MNLEKFQVYFLMFFAALFMITGIAFMIANGGLTLDVLMFLVVAGLMLSLASFHHTNYQLEQMKKETK